MQPNSLAKAKDEAFDAKEAASAEVNLAWSRYRSVKDENDPCIRRLDAKEQELRTKADRAMEQSRQAYACGKKAAASSHAANRDRYNDKARKIVARRRRLAEEVNAAKHDHEVAEAAYQMALKAFRDAKELFEAVTSRPHRPAPHHRHHAALSGD